MLKKLKVEGEITENMARKILGTLCEKEQIEEGEVGRTLSMHGFIDPVSGATIVAAIAAVAAVAIQVWQMKPKPEEWNRKKLDDAIKEEMTKEDVLEYKVVSIQGYKNLVEKIPDPCKVLIRNTKNDIEYTLVFLFSEYLGTIEIL